MREEGGVFRYIEVFESRKSVMERLRKSGGREEEDLKDLRRREERRGGRGRSRSKSRSRGRRDAPRGGGRRSRSMERGRPAGGRGRDLSRQEEEWFGGSREKASGYCVKLRGLPWETRKVGWLSVEKTVVTRVISPRTT